MVIEFFPLSMVNELLLNCLTASSKELLAGDKLIDFFSFLSWFMFFCDSDTDGLLKLLSIDLI